MGNVDSKKSGLGFLGPASSSVPTLHDQLYAAAKKLKRSKDDLALSPIMPGFARTTNQVQLNKFVSLWERFNESDDFNDEYAKDFYSHEHFTQSQVLSLMKLNSILNHHRAWSAATYSACFLALATASAALAFGTLGLGMLSVLITTYTISATLAFSTTVIPYLSDKKSASATEFSNELRFASGTKYS